MTIAEEYFIQLANVLTDEPTPAALAVLNSMNIKSQMFWNGPWSQKGTTIYKFQDGSGIEMNERRRVLTAKQVKNILQHNFEPRPFFAFTLDRLSDGSTRLGTLHRRTQRQSVVKGGSIKFGHAREVLGEHKRRKYGSII